MWGLIHRCVLGTGCRYERPYDVTHPRKKPHDACRAYKSRAKGDVTPTLNSRKK
jgi:hypothetical protein